MNNQLNEDQLVHNVKEMSDALNTMLEGNEFDNLPMKAVSDAIPLPYSKWLLECFADAIQSSSMQGSPDVGFSPLMSAASYSGSPMNIGSESLITEAIRMERNNRVGNRRSRTGQLMRTIDHDIIDVDQSDLGLLLCTDQRNEGVRLLGLFRQMHYFLNDVLSSPYSNNAGDNNVYMASPMTTMPQSLNLSLHVKQAIRQSKVFMCNLERVLNANKIYDFEKYRECERLVLDLRRTFAILETYKYANIEHSYGFLPTPAKRVLAQRLEILITLLNNMIRETHMCVHLFDWLVSHHLHRKEPVMYKVQIQQQQYLQSNFELQQLKLASVGPTNGVCWKVAGVAESNTKQMIQTTLDSYTNAYAAFPQDDKELSCVCEDDRYLIRYIG